MAGSRRRASQAPNGRRAGRSGASRSVGWVWMGALALIVAGVVFAREAQLKRGAAPAESTQVEVEATSSPVTEARLPVTAGAAATSTHLATATTSRTVRPTATPAVAHRATTPTSPAALHPAPTATHALAANSQTTLITPAAAVALATAGATTTAKSSGASGAVALTFDAGADRGYAQDILDTLADEHVSASFGITGAWAKANPDLVRRMASDGHLIINHTLDHRSFTGVSDNLGGLSAARRRTELEEADAIIAPLIGHSTTPYYRLPYGDDDAHVAADVLPSGYRHKVGWTVDSLGWRGSSSTDIIARCLRLAAPGGIYVFHVGRESQDSLALPHLIRALKERGFGFQRVDQA